MATSIEDIKSADREGLEKIAPQYGVDPQGMEDDQLRAAILEQADESGSGQAPTPPEETPAEEVTVESLVENKDNTRKVLDQMAKDAGIENPEKLANRQAVADAIVNGLPEEAPADPEEAADEAAAGTAPTTARVENAADLAADRAGASSDRNKPVANDGEAAAAAANDGERVSGSPTSFDEQGDPNTVGRGDE